MPMKIVNDTKTKVASPFKSESPTEIFDAQSASENTETYSPCISSRPVSGATSSRIPIASRSSSSIKHQSPITIASGRVSIIRAHSQLRASTNGSRIPISVRPSSATAAVNIQVPVGEQQVSGRPSRLPTPRSIQNVQKQSSEIQSPVRITNRPVSGIPSRIPTPAISQRSQVSELPSLVPVNMEPVSSARSSRIPRWDSPSPGCHLPTVERLHTGRSSRIPTPVPSGGRTPSLKLQFGDGIDNREDASGKRSQSSVAKSDTSTVHYCNIQNAGRSSSQNSQSRLSSSISEHVILNERMKRDKNKTQIMKNNSENTSIKRQCTTKSRLPQPVSRSDPKRISSEIQAVLSEARKPVTKMRHRTPVTTGWPAVDNLKTSRDAMEKLNCAKSADVNKGDARARKEVIKNATLSKEVKKKETLSKEVIKKETLPKRKIQLQTTPPRNSQRKSETAQKEIRKRSSTAIDTTKRPSFKQTTVRHRPTSKNYNKKENVKVIANPVKNITQIKNSIGQSEKSINKALKPVNKMLTSKTMMNQKMKPTDNAVKPTGKQKRYIDKTANKDDRNTQSCDDDTMEQRGFSHTMYNFKDGNIDEYLENQDKDTLMKEYQRLTRVERSRKEADLEKETTVNAQLRLLTEAKEANEMAAAELDMANARLEKAEHKFQRFQTEANNMYEKRNDVDNEAEDMEIQNQQYHDDIVAIITEINNIEDLIQFGKKDIRLRVFEIAEEAFVMQEKNEKIRKRLEQLKKKFKRSIGCKKKRDIRLEPENFNACYQTPVEISHPSEYRAESANRVRRLRFSPQKSRSIVCSPLLDRGENINMYITDENSESDMESLSCVSIDLPEETKLLENGRLSCECDNTGMSQETGLSMCVGTSYSIDEVRIDNEIVTCVKTPRPSYMQLDTELLPIDETEFVPKDVNPRTEEIPSICPRKPGENGISLLCINNGPSEAVVHIPKPPDGPPEKRRCKIRTYSIPKVVDIATSDNEAESDKYVSNGNKVSAFQRFKTCLANKLGIGRKGRNNTQQKTIRDTNTNIT